MYIFKMYQIIFADINIFPTASSNIDFSIGRNIS